MTAILVVLIAQATALPSLDTAYPEALQRSLRHERPLVVMVGADWCPGCVTMKRVVLPEVARSGGLVGVEFAYVDADREPELAGKLLRGNSIPQLVRFERRGGQWTSEHLVGAQNRDRVKNFVRALQPPVAVDSGPRNVFSSFSSWLNGQ